MIIVQAYKCPYTGKLFEEKDKYIKHIRKESAKQREIRKVAKLQTEFDELVVKMRNTCSTTDEICEFIMEHQRHFIANGARRDWHRRSTPLKFEIESIRIQATYRDNVSNTHHAPDGKPTNWLSDPKMPTGYPGWYGRISATFRNTDTKKKYVEYYSLSDIMAGSGIQTGSGGGGNASTAYEVYLFADDWPAMAAKHMYELLSVEDIK